MLKLPVTFSNLPSIEHPGDFDEMHEIIGGDLERRLDALLARLGGEWERPDWDGWAGEQVANGTRRIVAIEADDNYKATWILVSAKVISRSFNQLTKVSLGVAFCCFFVSIYLTHDVWELSASVSLLLWIAACVVPPSLVVGLQRVLLRKTNRSANEELLASVLEHSKASDLGMTISFP